MLMPSVLKKMIPQQALYAKGPSKEIGLDLFTTYWKLPFYQSSDDYHIINTKLNLLYIFVADRINAFLALSLLRIAVLPSWKRLTGGRFFSASNWIENKSDMAYII